MSSINLYRISNADLTDECVEEVIWLEEGSKEVQIRPEFPGRLFTFVEPAETPERAHYIRPVAVRALDVPARQAVGAVLLLKPDARKRLLYAATWGSGRFQLQSSRLESDAGLRCALNLISGEKAAQKSWNPARVRALKSKRVGENTLITETQSSRKAPIDTFPFSADADQLRRVTGTPTDTAAFGSTISGGVSIQVKRPNEARNLVTLCKNIERIYKSTDYQRHFAWIDNVSPIYDVTKIERVYDVIIESIRVGTASKFNLSPPSLIAWEEIATFQYQWGRKSFDVEEPAVETFRDFLVKRDLLPELSFETLRGVPKLHALNSNQERIQSWPINRCLSGEFTIGRSSSLCSSGRRGPPPRSY